MLSSMFSHVSSQTITLISEVKISGFLLNYFLYTSPNHQNVRGDLYSSPLFYCSSKTKGDCYYVNVRMFSHTFE